MSDDRKEEYREQSAIQDSFDTSSSSLEGSMAMQKQQKRSQKDDLINPEDVKHNLRRALLGEMTRWAPIGDTGQFKKETVQLTEEKLCNKKGFDMIWAEIEGTINKNLAGSYLPSSTIQKNVKSNIKTIIDQIEKKHEHYGIDDTSDASQIVDIVRTQIIATSSKARGGRGLESREKTVVKKITQAIKGEESGSENLKDKISDGLEF